MNAAGKTRCAPKSLTLDHAVKAAKSMVTMPPEGNHRVRTASISRASANIRSGITSNVEVPREHNRSSHLPGRAAAQVPNVTATNQHITRATVFSRRVLSTRGQSSEETGWL